MKHAVLGTGMVGNTIASKLVALGHEVRMGARDAANPKAAEWAQATGNGASQGTFADAAAFGEVVWNCTAGVASLEALGMAGADHLAGKILIDVSNPLDFSKGMPPFLSVCNTDSVGEQIQRAFPAARVVKTLNTINCKVMVNPSLAGADHTVFVSGNDAAAKAEVTTLLRDGFGWHDVLDLGDITTSRGTEAYLLLWLRLWGATKSGDINVKVVRP